MTLTNTLTGSADPRGIEQGHVFADHPLSSSSRTRRRQGEGLKSDRVGEVDIGQPRVLLEKREDFPVDGVQVADLRNFKPPFVNL